MKKQRFQYGISGYRWSPASFHVTKGLVGQKKKPLPLTSEERSEVGYRVITKGFQAAISYIKQIERKRKILSDICSASRYVVVRMPPLPNGLAYSK